MANFYVSSIAYAAVAQWAASTAYSVGQIVRQLGTPTVGNERCFRCSVAGTSAATEPLWVITKNGSTVSGTATFIECTGQEAYQTSGNWAAPAAKLQNFAIGTIMSPGDFVYVASNHSETGTGTPNIGLGISTVASAPLSILCVDTACSIPPTAANLTTGASLTFSVNAALSQTYMAGLSISMAVTTSLTFNGGFSRFDNMTITTASATGGAVTIAAGANVEWNNVSLAITNASNTTGGVVVQGRLVWRNSVCWTTFASSSPQIAFAVASTSAASSVILEGCDLSLANNLSNYLVLQGMGGGSTTLVNCKLPTTYPALLNMNSSMNYGRVEVINTDTTGSTGVYKHERASHIGSHQARSTAYMVGGATDGTTPIGWYIYSVTNSWATPFETMPLTTYNTSVGVAKTITIHGSFCASVWTGLVPTNAQVWLLVEYLGSSTTTQASYVETKTATPLTAGTEWPTETTTWAGQNRLNNTAYTQTSSLQPFTVTNNPGRLMFCSSNGTSGSSLPGAYATLTDGQYFASDGSLTPSAGIRFKMTATITPQLAGPIRVYIRVASQCMIIIDPKIYLS